MSHWRNRAAEVIRRVLEETEGLDEKAIRKALREAYPFGRRAHHPYRIWLDEIARQTGRKPPLGTRTRKPGQAPTSSPTDPNQIGLFTPDAVASTDDGAEG